MTIRRAPKHLATSLAVLLGLASGSLRAAERSQQKSYGEPKPDQALVYLIREGHFQGGGRTMFVFADDVFLGTLDNNSYTFAYVAPGKRLLWLNWAKINLEVELEAGKTYYFNVWTAFDPLDETSGKAFVAGVESYSTATAKETEKSAEHIRERYGKAQTSAAAKPADAPAATSLARREKHVAAWPKVDLAAHAVLCVEPFVMADPKAAQRSREYLVESAPQRIADLVVADLGDAVFERIDRNASCAPTPGAVILRARITQYKPGSETARFMLAGAGSAQIEAIVELFDSVSGDRLVELEPKGLWAWGGVVGAASGIAAIEKNVAYEIASYLRKSKGVALPEPAP
jgi:hypothetical protein